MVVLVISETSDSVNSFNFAICSFACMSFPVELVPSWDGWWRSWWQTIRKMPGLPVSSIPQCKYNRDRGACPGLFQAIGCFEPTFIEAHHVSNINCELRSLKLQMKTHCFVENIITSSNELFKYWESDLVEGIWKLHNSGWETVKGYVIVK